MAKLDGKIAVITGGGSGIGLAVAERFAREGARTVLVGRRQQRLDEAATRIGHGAYGISADVADISQVRALFDQLARVDLLVTCAGGAIFGAVDELDPSAWQNLFKARFFGQLNACHYAVPKMPEGSVILLCSGIAGRIGFPNYSGGAGLCGGIDAMGRALAVELAPRGIRVNVLSPGLIEDTEIENNLTDEELARFYEAACAVIPLARPGQSTDIADAALFLATCEYATGLVIDIDGGWTAS